METGMADRSFGEKEFEGDASEDRSDNNMGQ